ncbi:hypothetical protein [Deinococcus alpinitundrae]|uniref:hypothetical protein n=1 Tax=Deinococcus alpinitundrae TaxID=468913 RepID=UPI00137B0125|nr:hypothetical protein [Deinococcus alpinitundrae]
MNSPLNKRQKNTLKLSALGAGLIASLTACPRPVPPPSYSNVNLTFTFPAISRADAQNLMLAAYYYDGSETLKLLQQNPLSYGGYSGSSETITSAQLPLYNLDSALQNSKCSSPFVGGETKDRTQVSVTPNTVNTCNVYFSIYTDGGQHFPTSTTEKYMTNDLVSFASSNFTYSFVSPDGNSTESGSRKQGWTLIRHQVLQPSSTPGKYLVSMNSVPAAEQALPIRMHEPTNGLISQSIRGKK